MSVENTDHPTLSRRAFLGRASAAGALLLAMGQDNRAVARSRATLREDVTFEPDAFLRIDTDAITLFAKHDEMGQGIFTGLAIAVAEELEVAAADIDVVPARADTDYDHNLYRVQATGGSTSTWTSFEQMRRSGAAARIMLVAAAAKRWGVNHRPWTARTPILR